MTYTASGTKLTKVDKQAGTQVARMDYLGAIEYRNNSLQSIHHSEGRVVFCDNAQTLSLTTPINGGTQSFKAGKIIASNAISGNANVSMQANSSIFYSPLFSVESESILAASINASVCNAAISYEYVIRDYLGNGRVYFADYDGNGSISDAAGQSELIQEAHYDPWGCVLGGSWKDNGAPDNLYQYNACLPVRQGKELNNDFGLGLYDYGARWYDPGIGRWTSIDPMSSNMPRWSPFSYTMNSPIKFIDPDGMEPIKPQAGTAIGFIAFLNNTSTKMGTLTGSNAHNAMMRLGQTKMNWSHGRPEPVTTNPFNNSSDKYIYTEKGGWLDMGHVMFYAGRAYDKRVQKESGENVANATSPAQAAAAKARVKDINPIGEAVQEGYRQEMSDRIAAPHSAYSYEDLPSDKIGAEFGANYFNSNSNLTLGEQLLNYLQSLGATNPQNAPNYNNLPSKDPKDKPTRKNHTTTPVYTQNNQ